MVQLSSPVERRRRAGQSWRRRDVGVTKPPEQRVEELLDAADAPVAERGIDATTVEDITRAAGVAKGTFERRALSQRNPISRKHV